MSNLFSKISTALQISENQLRKTIALLDEGATIPFISRYRKEMTGSLDEVQVAAIRDLRDQYVELEKRREAILKSLLELEKLTPELEKAVRAAETLAKLETINEINTLLNNLVPNFIKFAALEDKLERCYRQYCMHQVKQDMPFMSLDDFRNMFEDLMEVIYKDEE